MHMEERAGSRRSQPGWEAAWQKKARLPRLLALPGLAGGNASPRHPPRVPLPNGGARHAIQPAIAIGPKRMGCILWALLAQRSRGPKGSLAQPDTHNSSPSCQDELFPRTSSAEGG